MAKAIELPPCVHRGEQVDMRVKKGGCCGKKSRIQYKHACAIRNDAWDKECLRCKVIEAPKE